MDRKLWNGLARQTRRYWVLAPVLAVALALGISTAVRGPQAQEQQPELLSAAAQKLHLQDSYQAERRFAGRVAARQHADAGFELAGKVSALVVKEGDRVVAGQALGRLDTEILAIERDQLLAQLADTQARAGLSQANMARQQSLQASGFSSQQRLDELHTEAKTLAASRDALSAQLASLDSRLRKSVLAAPYDAIVSRRYVDQGSVVSAGQPVLRLQQLGAMEAQVGVPVRFAGQLAEGETVTLSLRDAALSARVQAVGADVNPVTNTVSVRLSLPDASPGFNGDIIHLVLSERVPQSGYWINDAAITDGLRGLWTVYVLVPDAGHYRVEARDVQIQHAAGDKVFVQGALKDGDYLVASGVHRLVPGQQVTLVEQAETDAGSLARQAREVR